MLIEEQAAFRRGRPCVDSACTLKKYGKKRKENEKEEVFTY
jgi:hypothetical protein